VAIPEGGEREGVGRHGAAVDRYHQRLPLPTARGGSLRGGQSPAFATRAALLARLTLGWAGKEGGVHAQAADHVDMRRSVAKHRTRGVETVAHDEDGPLTGPVRHEGDQLAGQLQLGRPARLGQRRLSLARTRPGGSIGPAAALGAT
jgi:hypothetical protein